jgi:hypothetical protein
MIEISGSDLCVSGCGVTDELFESRAVVARNVSYLQIIPSHILYWE